MFKLKFGLIWTFIITSIFVMCLVVPGEQRGGVDMSIGLFMFFVAFDAIGIFMLVSGIKQLKKDRQTNKHGIVTYGQIIGIYKTGAASNGRKEFEAEILAFLPDEYVVRRFREVIGFEPFDFDVHDFVELKYYEGDVNIVQVVSENVIPSTALSLLKSSPQV